MAFSFSNLFAGSSILVFTHDQFILRGALVRKDDKDVKGVEIIAEATSMELNPDKALADVLETLQQVQKRLPKKAVMASAAMVSAVVELPVDPKKPKPAKQMQELVRWELVEDLGVYNDQWTLGAIAVGRGYMNSDQRQKVVKKIAEQRAENAGGRAPRFGDVCVSEKYLRSDQHDECLDIQEQLAEPDDNLVCDWKPFTLEVEDESKEQKEKIFWYCTGMGRFYRNQWARAFKTEGINLSGFVPLDAVPFSLFKELKDKQSLLFLELLREQVICYRLYQDDLGRRAITNLMVESRSEGELDQDMLVDICLNHVDESLQKVVASIPFDHDDDGDGDGDDRDEIRGNLETRLDRPVTRLAADQGFSGNTTFLAKLGANLLDGKKSRYLLMVPAADPPPPVYKNPAFLRLAIPSLLIAALAGNEVFTRMATQKMQAKLDAMANESSENADLSTEVARARAEADTLNKEIAVLSTELRGITTEISRLQKIFDHSTLPVDVLKVLGRTITEEVMLEKFIEPARSKRPGYHLYAWSVDDLSAQQFVSALGRNMMDINFEVSHPVVGQEKNRYNMWGFGIDLWVIPIVKKPKKKVVKK